MENTEKNIYDIVIIGESMAGKSTYISGLMEQTTAEKLKSITGVNTEGQTKIPVHYILSVPDTKLKVNQISWDIDDFCDKNADEKRSEIIDKLSTYFPSIENLSNDYFNGETYKKELEALDVADFIKNIINDAEIGGSGIISLVDITTPASDEIWAIISNLGLDGVKIRDTRGFFDETPERFNEMIKEICERDKDNKEVKNIDIDYDKEQINIIKKHLFERGMEGAEAIIFAGCGGSNALNKKINKDLYSNIFRELIKTAPMFTLIRTDRMGELYYEDENIDYKEAISKDSDGKYKKFKVFTELNSYRNLLEEFGIKETEKGVLNKVSKKYYTELLLPNVITENNTEDELKKWTNIYKRAVEGSFKEILENICKFKEDFEEASKNFEIFSKSTKFDMTDALKKIYNEKFNDRIFRYGKSFEDTDFHYSIKGIDFWERYAVWKICKEYLGGFVGVRGGLTTKKDGVMVGDVAMKIMELGYQIKSELYKEVVNSLSSNIEKYTNSAFKTKEEADREADRLKNMIEIKLSKELEYGVFTRYCTYKMLSQDCLESALNRVKEEFELSENCIIRHCLTELEGIYDDIQWDRDKYNISVIKQLIWYLIDETIIRGKKAMDRGWI